MPRPCSARQWQHWPRSQPRQSSQTRTISSARTPPGTCSARARLGSAVQTRSDLPSGPAAAAAPTSSDASKPDLRRAPLVPVSPNTSRCQLGSRPGKKLLRRSQPGGSLPGCLACTQGLQTAVHSSGAGQREAVSQPVEGRCAAQGRASHKALRARTRPMKRPLGMCRLGAHQEALLALHHPAGGPALVRPQPGTQLGEAALQLCILQRGLDSCVDACRVQLGGVLLPGRRPCQPARRARCEGHCRRQICQCSP